MEKKALGKGIESLLPGRTMEADGPGRLVQTLPVGQILPNQFQPRKSFPLEDLNSLANSIKENGILQPLLVRRTGDGMYELIAGERRLRAAKLVNLSEVPVVIRPSIDQDSTLLALVENIQRQALNPMDEARAYNRLVTEYGLTQEMIAERIGRERSSIANFCRLVSLPNDIQGMLESAQLTLGHAKAILGLQGHALQITVATRIIREQLSVRQTETLIKKLSIKENGKQKKLEIEEAKNTHVEEQLRKHLNTKIRIHSHHRGGQIVLSYYSDEDLARIVDVILS